MRLLDMGCDCSKKLLDSIVKLSGNPEDLEIPSQFKELVIHIQGDQISGSIDAQVAGAMVQLQQSIYRLVAKTKYGENATISSLTEEDLESFKLQFIVSAGSTQIATEIWEKAESLVKIFTKDMSPRQRLFLIFVCATLLLGYGCAREYADFEKEALRSATQLNMSKEETKRAELLLSQIQAMTAENAVSFAKAVKGANSIRYGERTFSKDEIMETQKRAPKIYMDWEKTTANYVVIGIDCTRADILIATLVNAGTGETVKSTYTAENGDDEVAQQIKKELAMALASGRPVKLELNIGKKGGHVEKSTILNIIEE